MTSIKATLENAHDSITRAQDIISCLAGVSPHDSLNEDNDHGHVLIFHLVMDKLTLAKDHIEDATEKAE